MSLYQQAGGWPGGGPDIFIAAALAVLGWLLRRTWQDLAGRMEDQSHTLARRLEEARSDLRERIDDAIRSQEAFRDRLEALDRRMTVIESWRHMREIIAEANRRREGDSGSDGDLFGPP